jgi:hypothetical protein
MRCGPGAVFALTLVVLSQAVHARKSAGAPRLPDLLQQSGLKYQQVGDGIWLLGFGVGPDKTVRVFVTESGGLALIGTTLKRDGDADVTRDELLAINRLNAEVDRVKIGLDDKMNLFVRVDLTLRTLDAEDLKVNVSQVAAAADKAATALAPRFVLR